MGAVSTIFILLALFPILSSSSPNKACAPTLKPPKICSSWLQSDFWNKNVQSKMPQIFVEKMSTLNQLQTLSYLHAYSISNKFDENLCNLASLDCTKENQHIILQNDNMYGYSKPKRSYVTVSNVSFFREKQIREGNSIWVGNLNSKLPPQSFLPDSLASQIPLAYAPISKLLSSPATEKMKEKLHDALDACNSPRLRGEVGICARSLEEMIRFAEALTGKKKLTAKTSSMLNQTTASYLKISHVEKCPQQTIVSCHGVSLPFATFFCHALEQSVLYSVEFTDGKSAVAMCHMDTSAWPQSHPAFSVLGVRPGEAEICHFFGNNDIAWVGSD